MFVADLTPVLRQTFGIDESVDGLVVTKVSPASEAAQNGMTPGDIILQVNQHDVKNYKDAHEQVETLMKTGKAAVLLLVDHQGRGDVQFVALKLAKPDQKK